MGPEVADKSSESSDGGAGAEKPKQESEQIVNKGAQIVSDSTVEADSKIHKAPSDLLSDDVSDKTKNKTGTEDKTRNSSKLNNDSSVENDFGEISDSDLEDEIEILFDGQDEEENFEEQDENEISGSDTKTMIENESGLGSDELKPKDESNIDESESSGESIKLATAGAKPNYVDASGFRRR